MAAHRHSRPHSSSTLGQPDLVITLLKSKKAKEEKNKVIQGASVSPGVRERVPSHRLSHAFGGLGLPEGSPPVLVWVQQVE